MVRGTERDSVARLRRWPRREIVLVLVLATGPGEVGVVAESGEETGEESGEGMSPAAWLGEGIEK